MLACGCRSTFNFLAPGYEFSVSSLVPAYFVIIQVRFLGVAGPRRQKACLFIKIREGAYPSGPQFPLSLAERTAYPFTYSKTPSSGRRRAEEPQTSRPDLLLPHLLT